MICPLTIIIVQAWIVYESYLSHKLSCSFMFHAWARRLLKFFPNYAFFYILFCD